MPTASKIAAAKASPARVGQVSVPMPAAPAGGGLIAQPQVNAVGEVFWNIGSPLCAGMNPHPYPGRE